MCGRYSLFHPAEDVEERFDAAFDDDFDPRYNAAPRQALPVITNETPDTIQRMEWGLVPSWADDRSDYEFINARAETVDEKASFSDAYERRRCSREQSERELDTPTGGRCLVPADGFYEWAEESGSKQPYRVSLPDDGLFAMAGLYERWDPPQRQTGLGEFGGGGGRADDETVETFTILTTEPNDDVAPLHHRMPVVLAEGDEDAWLHGSPDDREELLRPYPGEMTVRPVSRAVNDPSNDSPAVLESPAE